MEKIPEYINILSYLFVVVYMLSVALETASREIVKTLGHLNLMGRALLANFVIIPIVGIIIANFLIYRRRSEPDSCCSLCPRADCSLYSLPASPKVIAYLLSLSYLFSVCWQS
jgi:purine-cytosine permease-like protein